MKTELLAIERTFNAPIEKVWRAITDKDLIRQWFFDIKAFKPEVGFEFQFIAGKDDVSYLHLCKIIEVVPGQKLRYSWRYEGFSGNSFVTFELFAEGPATKLRLSHEGLETLPVSKPGFLNGYYVPGWTQIIGGSLKEFLEKTK